LIGKIGFPELPASLRRGWREEFGLGAGRSVARKLAGRQQSSIVRPRAELPDPKEAKEQDGGEECRDGAVLSR
jgi:hypothetical protein